MIFESLTISCASESIFSVVGNEKPTSITTLTVPTGSSTCSEDDDDYFQAARWSSRGHGEMRCLLCVALRLVRCLMSLWTII